MMGELLQAAGVKPAFAITDAAGKPVAGIETHSFRNGGASILALMTNPQLRVDELGPPEFRSNERFAKPVTVRVSLPGELFVYDVRAGKALGRMRQMNVTVQPYEPSIFSISPIAFPDLEVSLPERERRGDDFELSVGAAASSPAA